MARSSNSPQLILNSFILAVQNLDGNIKIIIYMAFENEIWTAPHILKQNLKLAILIRKVGPSELLLVSFELYGEVDSLNEFESIFSDSHQSNCRVFPIFLKILLHEYQNLCVIRNLSYDSIFFDFVFKGEVFFSEARH